MNPIQVKSRLTLPEFMKACSIHWKKHKQGTLSNTLIGTFGVACGISAIAFDSLVLGLIVLVVSGLLLIVVASRSILYRRAFYKGSKYTKEISYAFTESGVHLEIAEAKSDMKWEYFLKYVETPEFILLYATKHNFSIIPKSGFSDPADGKRLTDWMDTKLKRTN